MRSSSEFTNPLPLRYTALGLLMGGPRHGYELHRDFLAQFGAVWHAGRSQFYAELNALAAVGLVRVTTVPQAGRPPRRVFEIAPAGREAFLTWARAPVPHIRQVRVEFLTKLHFFELLSLPGAPALISAQIDVCRRRLVALTAGPAATRFDETVCDFRRRQIEAIVSWLESCRERLR